jgi:hypothetical protein
VCAIALGLTACGGSGDKLAKLPGGRAAGPGFQFQLSGDWRALRDLRELSRVVTGSAAKQVPGLDVGAGIVFGGAWADASDSKARRTANVVIEPVTSDSSLEDVARSSVALLARTPGGGSRRGPPTSAASPPWPTGAAPSRAAARSTRSA